MAGRLVAAEQRHSVIVIAPTQSGKTTGLAVPAVLEWDGPVLACSVKTDLLRDTLVRRARLGEVKVFDPTAITGFPRAGWSPLGASHTWQAARETADRLVASAQPAHGSGEATFWNQAGARYLAPLLFAAASTHRTMVDVVSWVDTDDQEQITNALGGELWEQPRTADARDERAALETLDGIWRSDDRLRSSLVMTAALALKAYADPTVQECSREGELTAQWLLGRRRQHRLPVGHHHRPSPPATPCSSPSSTRSPARSTPAPPAPANPSTHPSSSSSTRPPTSLHFPTLTS